MFPGRFPNVPWHNVELWLESANDGTSRSILWRWHDESIVTSSVLKLRLRLRLPLLGSRMRFSINNSLHKLNLTSNIFSNSFPSINLLNRRKPHPLHRLHNHPGLKRPIHQHQWYLKPLKLDLIHPSILKRWCNRWSTQLNPAFKPSWTKLKSAISANLLHQHTHPLQPIHRTSVTLITWENTRNPFADPHEDPGPIAIDPCQGDMTNGQFSMNS